MGYRNYYSSKILLLVLTASIIPILGMSVQDSFAGASKSFTGNGDGTSWSDGDNWFPTGAPTSTDDIRISCDFSFDLIDNFDEVCPFVVNLDVPFTVENRLTIRYMTTFNQNDNLSHDVNNDGTINIKFNSVWNVNDLFTNVDGEINVSEGGTINNLSTFDMQDGDLDLECDATFNNQATYKQGGGDANLLVWRRAAWVRDRRCRRSTRPTCSARPPARWSRPDCYWRVSR